MAGTSMGPHKGLGWVFLDPQESCRKCQEWRKPLSAPWASSWFISFHSRLFGHFFLRFTFGKSQLGPLLASPSPPRCPRITHALEKESQSRKPQCHVALGQRDTEWVGGAPRAPRGRSPFTCFYYSLLS